ncbi:hybrid PKS/NRPS enzyme [Pochonia chlamydosporia 170]|uniref:Hybrid PKS/NRPS enzyme n=1 Tax=Pochonia chlamydosporia 170 TaxID=1380566 RepID=A0A179FML4_METCM|nr:hybrid PKS/NRPS enzyme [Pochonia chlamydosporia 170]OAQ66822.1 hybrid PKS/NRPS enzyme [Pochonia chlamydosporia 170]
MVESKLFVFGPQALSFNAISFESLLAKLHREDLSTWALDVISTLPATLTSLSTEVPKLLEIDVKQLFDPLIKALRTGELPANCYPLPNALLSPLVVISQLADYRALIRATEPSLDTSARIPAQIIADAETLGLCTGVLTAFAVASSATIADLLHHGAVSTRLAMISGALVDADDASNEEGKKSTSFSASWAAASLEHLNATLQKYPEAYLSVRMDDKRATITSAKDVAPELQQALKDRGIHVSHVALNGRFHWSSHNREIEKVIEFVNKDPALQLLDASRTVIPTRANSGGHYLQSGKLHDIALRAILTDQSLWYETVELAYSGKLQSPDSRVLCFGSERCLPPTIVRKLDSRLIHVADADLSSGSGLGDVQSILSDSPDNRIAVIGMSCHVPNAEDLDAFWQVLLSGESQHREVPEERFSMKSHFREVDPARKWYGNFIRDHDAFDHKFFKKSPREMGSTDPQHRIALQLAYQAVQQSGYFGVPEFNKHIGVYVGHANTDYEHNVRSYPANAYSATGNLKSLLAGKISHYFGWTGPSLTLDTACSSSSVAVHLACRAILSGEINGALAGGVNILTSPEWYHNLAGASFLSPTGQCKSFDARGDGYCRGEGSGMVFLKKLSAALADGDQVLGVVASTSVLQNQNCTPITVPNSTSLGGLFGDVIKRARIKPHDISVVEAHGTGTAVGDPAEYDGIRQVLAGPTRPDRLSLTAVKGSIGHLEVASGVASLIKVLLMIHEAAVPPQASFQSINPDLKAKPEDNIDITTVVKPWKAATRAALINNYGASGSNASMVVTEAPKATPQQTSTQLADKAAPFWLSGTDDARIKTYAAKLRNFVQQKRASDKVPTLANLSFQLARQSNRTLNQALILNATSIEDLDQKLSAFESGSGTVSIKKPDAKPVILCFGGQISTFVGLDKDVFDNVAVLRSRLDECDATCLALGLDSIYSSIFQRTPLSDIVKLQTALFSMQYSCAMAWIDCGIKVSAIVGHSFGELTGLCVSGILSLRDALKLVSTRAKIIQQSWPAEKGSMMAAEGDLATVERLVATGREKSGKDVSIACYNGPTSYTIAGPAAGIQAVEELAKTDETFKGMRVKVLNVTNAFHCSLVDSLKEELVALGETLAFRPAKIRLERATKLAETGNFAKDYVSQHLRNPVYFHQAVKRLSDEYRDAIWLEAGSNSTVTNMASKALGGGSSNSFFQGVNITVDSSYGLLADATTKLWRQGLDVTFWSHHKSQIADYTPILLPPYQFEKSRHWLDIKEIPTVSETAATTAPAPVVEPEKGLFTFFGFLDDSKRSIRFRVNTNTPEFKQMVEAHVMANTVAVMPGMLPVEIAIDALSTLRPEFKDCQYQPELHGLVYYSPLVPQHCSAVWLDVQAADPSGLTWEWKFVGQDSKGTATRHMSGSITFYQPTSPAVQSDFARLSRLGSHKRCKRILDGGEADDVVVGRNIYRAFETVIDYKDLYRHLTKLVGKDGDSAGRVIRSHDKEGWLDSVLTDCFCQVAGVAVNLFSDTADFADRGIYIGDRVDRWIRAPGLLADPAKPKEWEVFAMSNRESDTAFVSDVFAFDARDGSLYEAILGIRYSKVPMAGIRKALNRIVTENPNAPGSTISPPQTPPVFTSPNLNPLPAPQQQVSFPAADINGINGFSNVQEVPTVNGVNGTRKPAKAAKESPGAHIPAKAKEILSNLSGVEVEDIQDDSDLVEMGIDSLMAMELIREVDAAFKCTLETDQLMGLTDFRSLVVCISTTMGLELDGNTDSGYDSETGPQTNGVDGKSVNGTIVTNGVTNGLSHDANIPASTVLNVFRATKAVTDEFIHNYKMSNYYTQVRPVSTMLCAAYIVEAFDKLGCSFKDAQPGQQLASISYLPKHEKFMKELYKIIGPDETGLVDIVDGKLVRTAVPCPNKPASTLLEEALRDEPDHAPEFKLSALTGCKLAECLTGKADGLQIIFGSAEGRKTVSDVYAVAPLNYTWIKQAEFFIQQLLQRLPANGLPIKILEMGAGTGGTTATMVPMLAALGVPVTYTFTDLSSSLVAAARKRFKQYPFMEFKVVNIESTPDKALLESQHIILANACVHATRSLPISLRNIRQILRSDGMLMLLEETEQLPWVDFVFGLLEGWWLFEDGRVHAQVTAEHWEKDLRGAGFGHVDYTDGNCREAQVQRIIFGFASDIRYADSDSAEKPSYPIHLRHTELTSVVDRQAVIDDFIRKYTADFREPGSSSSLFNSSVDGSEGLCVLVTGATGSLGSHIVSGAAQMPRVTKVICLNRLGSIDAVTRQEEAFHLRGIEFEPMVKTKLQILESDSSKPLLGLPSDTYNALVQSVTHIVHNAWPMSLTRTTKAYESQFQVMRNLIDLAGECTSLRPSSFRFSFQFISSIGAVGYYPLWTGRSLAPELPTTADTALPVGYADAKIVCERMLEETLRRFPHKFRGMGVRIAQITGSRTNGYWNPMEHFSFFVKSSRFLRSLPNLQGTLSWSPVNDVAGSLLDLLMSDEPSYPIYHIENPARQPWPEMIKLLASELDVPSENIVPYDEWLERVRSCEAPMSDNPAKQLMSFWETHFLRMSTGPLVLDTKHSREHSKTMRESGPVEDELVKRYIRRWKEFYF